MGENDPDVLGIVGASAWRSWSATFPGPARWAAVRVGRVNGEFIAFPTALLRWRKATWIMVYVGSESDLVMFEGSAPRKSPRRSFLTPPSNLPKSRCQPLIASRKRKWLEKRGNVHQARGHEVRNVVSQESLLEEAKETHRRPHVATPSLIPGKDGPRKAPARRSWTTSVTEKLVEKHGEEAKSARSVIQARPFSYIQKGIRPQVSILKDSRSGSTGEGIDDLARRSPARSG